MLAPLTLPLVFTAPECTRIIALARDSGLAAGGLVKARADSAIRKAQIAWLDDAGPADWVMQRITGVVAEANRHFGFELTEFGERIQVARYQEQDSSHFDWHSDTGSADLAARRKLTLVIQLSESGTYTGGGLETWSGNQPSQSSRNIGTATLFPAFVLHRVTPVTAGERWSLTTWIHGPMFR